MRTTPFTPIVRFAAKKRSAVLPFFWLLVLLAAGPGSQAQWTTAKLSQARGGLVGVTAGNLVFFAGGRGATGYSDVVDIYDHSTQTWRTDRLSQPRAFLAAATFQGKVYFGGGETATGVSDVVDIYDTATGTWSTHTLAVPRSHLSAATGDYLVYFYGGVDQAGKLTHTIEVYSNQQNENTWYSLDNDDVQADLVALTLPPTLDGNPATALFAGGTAILNGVDRAEAVDEVVAYQEFYKAGTTNTLYQGAYALAGTIGKCFSYPQSAIFAGGRFVNEGDTDRAYDPAYDPSDPVDTDQATVIMNPSFSRITTGTFPDFRLSVARSRLAAATIADANLMFFGGGRVKGAASNVVDVFDGMYFRADTLSQARFRLAAAGVGLRVLFAGGFTGTGQGFSDVVDIYTESLQSLPPPVITRHPEPASLTVCAGGTARTAVAATGPNFRYQWFKGAASFLDGTFLVGQDKPELTLTNVQPADAGSYYCHVWGGREGAWSRAFTLQVATLALGQPGVASGRACAGQAVTVNVGANCTGLGLTVQLSNAFGSFANPTVLGTAQPGANPFTLPATLAPGSGYRVRVVGGAPTQASPASAPFSVAGPGLALAPTVGGAPACRGGQVTVSFGLPGGSCPFPGGNGFTAQLSSAFGSFNNPTTLGTITPGQSTVTIPASVAAGTGYRIRVVSSQPVMTSASSGLFQIRACNGRLSAEEPHLVVAPNPVEGGKAFRGEIRCRVSGMDSPQFALATVAGRGVGVSVQTDGSGEWVLTPKQRLAPGVYLLQATEGSTRLAQRVLVVE